MLGRLLAGVAAGVRPTAASTAPPGASSIHQQVTLCNTSSCTAGRLVAARDAVRAVLDGTCAGATSTSARGPTQTQVSRLFSSLTQPLRPSDGLHAAQMRSWWRRFSQQTESEIAGASAPGSNSASTSPRSVLEHAAEARLQKLRAQAQADQGPSPDQHTSIAGKAWGLIRDSTLLGLVGTAGFAGYYTFAYPEASDLDVELRQARTALVLAATAPGSVDAAGVGTTSTTGAPIEPPAFPPLTRTWCWAMEHYISARRYVERQVKEYKDPTYHKLLPDMQPELRGRAKTLVLDLDGLLVHKEWTRQSGWKIYKRPCAEDFIAEVGGYFEVVIFTDQPASYAEPIINKLDPQRYIMFRLYRPETQYHNGKHVRDLSKLNRDLSQVLMISSNSEAWEFQPENTIKLRPWDKDPQDTTLLDLIPMLQLIATKGIKDVRDVVRSYDGEEDIGKAFKARMAQLSASKQAQHTKPRGLLGGLAKS